MSFAAGLLQGVAGGMNAQASRILRERELSALEALGPRQSAPQDVQRRAMGVIDLPNQASGEQGGSARASRGGRGVSAVDPDREWRVWNGFVQRGMPEHVADGIVANMIAESRLDPGINEIAPLVPGSRGGFGFNQWTGPRRRAFEAEAALRGVALDDEEFQIEYTMHELLGPERRAYDRLMATNDSVESARAYSEHFLRPGIPHMENRLAHARRIASARESGAFGPAREAPRAARTERAISILPVRDRAPASDQDETTSTPQTFNWLRNHMSRRAA